MYEVEKQKQLDRLAQLYNAIEEDKAFVSNITTENILEEGPNNGMWKSHIATGRQTITITIEK